MRRRLVVVVTIVAVLCWRQSITLAPILIREVAAQDDDAGDRSGRESRDDVQDRDDFNDRDRFVDRDDVDDGEDAGARDALAGEGPRDPAEEWFSSDYEPDEVLALALSKASRKALLAEGFRVLDERVLGHFNQNVVRLRAPRGVDAKAALARVRGRGAAQIADFNHRFRLQADPCRGPHCQAHGLIRWSSACAGVRFTLGMIDTGVRRDHLVFRGQDVRIFTVRGAGRSASNQMHGTAVASLLLGTATGPAVGLLPRARLIAVDAFHRVGGTGDEMDAFDFLAAMDILLGQKVRLINLSFAGPHNVLVAHSLRAAERSGVVLVAAAGNAGPKAAPSYPAAYDEVVAVTAVRADGRVYARASQGSHIDVAAPGVDIWAADGGVRSRSAGRRFSGSSYAVPYVTATLAAMWTVNPTMSSNALRAALFAGSRDLGSPGVDAIYGHGLAQASDVCARVKLAQD